MRVENLRFEKDDGIVRAVATVIWEDCIRPTQEIFFGTVDKFSDSLSCNPHAFLVACIMPAFNSGEQRLLIEEEICPELKDGLITAMHWMRFWWYKPDKNIVKIEAKTKPSLPLPRRPERAGVFFSGGIDALATLRANRLNYPLEHPGSIKDGLLVCGLEIREPRIFGYVLDSVKVLAEDAGITLIPIHTNIRSLGPEDDEEFWGKFWLNEFMGATFSAIAHAFSKRLTEVSINSCHDIPNLIPYSSHPLINPNYSSGDLRIRHEGITLSRFEKTKLVASWDLGLQHLRVCNRTELYQPGTLNCGQCEKCVRTMLALLGCGVLERTSAFPIREVNEELVIETVQLGANTIPLYGELLKPLAGINRHDLVGAIEQKIDEYHRSKRREKRRKRFIEPIIEYDQKYLGGSLRKLKRIGYPGKGIWTTNR